MPWKERYALTGFGDSTTTMRWNSSFGATATGCFKKSAPLLAAVILHCKMSFLSKYTLFG